MNQYVAAYHESAHAVVCAVLELPLQDTGIHIDTIGGGITFNLHRKPGDPSNAPIDIIERERSIVMIKAGYVASLKIFPGAPKELAANDREEEIKLLNEMYSQNTTGLVEANKRLTKKSPDLVDQHWNAIQSLALALLAKPITQRLPEHFEKWDSPDTHEQRIDGDEVAAILRQFQLSTIVRKESEGTYYAPDIHPGRRGGG